MGRLPYMYTKYKYVCVCIHIIYIHIGKTRIMYVKQGSCIYGITIGDLPEMPQQCGTMLLPYPLWLQQWLRHLTPIPLFSKTPLQASNILTPLRYTTWQGHLRPHPHQDLVQYFLQGIATGFRIGFDGSSTQSAKNNLKSAVDHLAVIDDYLHDELSLGRISGPYRPSMCPDVHINRFGVIPKNHQLGKWRLITDLSYPPGNSVNDGIPAELCSLSYVTIDDAILNILESGRDTMLAKIDIKSAFRLLPVHPADRHLLGMRWKDQVYIDHCIPFGLRSAPKLFNILADLLAEIAQNAGVSYLIHYLDDYLTMGPPASSVCQNNVNTFLSLCAELGVPLATDKLEGPSTTLSFLGIILDTHQMEIRLPSNKLIRMLELLTTWLPRRKARKREILSLVGTLQHATKVVRPGRSFVSRMYATAAKLREMHYITRLNKAFQSDLYWWYIFLQSWNGLSILRHPSVPSHPNFCSQTDASGTWGCAAVLGSQWLQWQWPPEWYKIEIMAKELVPIIFACIVWGPRLSKRHINFQCDNASLVIAINKGSSKDKFVMHLLRSLWFFVAHFDIYVTASHLPGLINITADHLSRGNVAQAFTVTPTLAQHPTLIPPFSHETNFTPIIGLDIA